MKLGWVYKNEIRCGRVWEDDDGCHFQYAESYLQHPVYGPVSRTLPLRTEEFSDTNMLPFFDGLIPEGWLLQLAIDNWKLNPRDRMMMLLTLCKDCIGDVSIVNAKPDELPDLL